MNVRIVMRCLLLEVGSAESAVGSARFSLTSFGAARYATRNI